MAAAAGGVTSMVCLPNTDPVIDDVPASIHCPACARDPAQQDHSIGAVTKNLAGKDLWRSDCVTRARARFTEGVAAVGDARVMLRASATRVLRPLIIQHPEHPSLPKAAPMSAGDCRRGSAFRAFRARRSDADRARSGILVG